MSAPPLDPSLDRFLQTSGILHVAADGLMAPVVAGSASAARVLLPGSFNPVHRGHWSLADAASKMLGQPVAFELSVANVDKPALTADEIRRRLVPFNWQASVWLTHAPRFIDKAERFPGATFVVGADTALRIVLPRYYGDDEASMLASLARIGALGCRFLVACRADGAGKCLGRDDLPIPAAFGELFLEIPPEQFRWDVSSTALRSQGHTR